MVFTLAQSYQLHWHVSQQFTMLSQRRVGIHEKRPIQMHLSRAKACDVGTPSSRTQIRAMGHSILRLSRAGPGQRLEADLPLHTHFFGGCALGRRASLSSPTVPASAEVPFCRRARDRHKRQIFDDQDCWANPCQPLVQQHSGEAVSRRSDIWWILSFGMLQGALCVGWGRGRGPSGRR